MTQRALVRIGGVDPGDSRSVTFNLTIEFVLYGDELVGTGSTVVTLDSISSAAVINAAIIRGVVDKVAESDTALAPADVRLLNPVR